MVFSIYFSILSEALNIQASYYNFKFLKQLHHNRVLKVISKVDSVNEKIGKGDQQNLLIEALNYTAAVSITDSKGIITFVNTLFCNISGYSQNELLGKNHNLLKSKQHSDHFFQSLWQTISNGRPWKGEICNLNKSGEAYWVQTSIIPFKNKRGKIEGYTSIQVEITGSKEAQDSIVNEEQFRKNEFNLNQAQKIARIGSFDTTHSTKEIWWSNELYTLFGLSPDNFTPQRDSFYKLLHPEDQPSFEKLVQSLVNDEKTQFEFRAKHTSGKWLHLELIAEAKYDCNNNFNGSRGTMQDITERREAEAALNYAYNIINRSPAVVFRWENIQDLPVDFVSKNVLELTGYSTEDFLNKQISYDDIIHPEDRERVSFEVSQANTVNNNNMYHHEPYRLITKNGEIKWVLDTTYIRRNTAGKVMFREGIVYDITKQRLAEEDLRKNEALLARMSETAKIGGWELDVNSLVIDWTEETYFIYELDPNKKPDLSEGIKYYHPDDRPKIEKAVHNAIHLKEPFDLEVKFITAKGNHLWVRASGRPITKNGNTVKVTGTFQDITERKKTELSIQHHLQLLEQKNKELNQFAYIASHDLQEPLRTVSNYVELFNWKYHDKLDNDANLYLSYITRSVDRMRDLLHELLEYTSIGKYNTPPAQVDCNNIIEQVKNDLSAQLTEKKAILKIEKLPQIKGHEHELRSLFQNLISNAIKFCKPDTNPEISISANRIKKQWVFAVKDNGIGIEENYKEKIFSIFQRLHSQDLYEGTGIGLARCLKIVELHGGKIWVESTANEGSTFYFSIPN
ncbi:PAS domain-containing protein [uncultured Roseivirga sp.]|uniref:PAS domain-containing sensor histidine kinase n=1 Tax=uncultured Roseivirga sp. TaxID=543088 RepID=UPI0030D87BBC|tara:strand:+ start:10085 stop:12472 length:2388 start_codon:yes stop_codon:yes gene_type:complete